MQQEPTTQHQQRTDFKIWQQNLRKSSNAWEHLLKNLNPDNFDMACIQEPFLNPVNLANASSLRRYWDVVYPTGHHTNQNRTQVIMLINKKISKNKWHAIPIQSTNVMAIELSGDFGKVRFYNIYNPCDHDGTLHFLERHMQTEHNARRANPQQLAQGEEEVNTEHIIWLGDFNRHHPMWELTSNSHLFTAANLDAAGVLINLLALYNLIQVLPPGIATLEASSTKNLTRPDNVFCSAQLQHAFTACNVEYHLRPVITDHFPIISSLELQPERINCIPRHNYREADWDEINEALAADLSTIPPPTEIMTKVQFEEAFDNLTSIIAKVVDAKVPKSKPSPYAKRWWSKSLDIERKEVHKLGRKSRAKLVYRNDPIHEQYRKARNAFSESIRKAKESHWTAWLETMTPAGVWNFHHYAASNPEDQMHTRIATLKDPERNHQNSTQTNDRKASSYMRSSSNPPRPMST
jgi:endonuclease/exonuclease/phosphatase family metal-dependent hydrolase